MNFRGLCLAAVLWAGVLPLEVEAAPVSLHVVDGDVRAVLASVARLGGWGLVLDDSVRGTVTIELDEAEPQEIFDMIAASKGLSIERRDGVMVITAGKTGSSRGRYQAYTFPIRYADLNTLCQAVEMALERERDRGQAGGTGESVHREDDTDRRVLADPATATLILYGSPAEAQAARTIIAALDHPIRQVSLEAKVIAIQKDAAKQLGVEWEWSKIPQYPDFTTDYETRRRTVQNPDGSYTTVTEDIPKETAERTWRNGESIPGIIQFGRGPGGHPFEFYYAARLQALVTDGKAKVLARPNITTLQGREAVINIGGEVPVPTVATTNATTTTSIEYREAGIILRCTPRVNPDGTVTAQVHTEVSSPVYVDSLKAYRFQKRSADTSVRLRDGETMVIGGLIGSEESRILSKVPFLGDLPILGIFFKSVSTNKTDSEIMIFLTARVVDDAGSGGAAPENAVVAGRGESLPEKDGFPGTTRGKDRKETVSQYADQDFNR
ncbi:MAG: pilus assembly protein PilQ [Schwartzia sp.]|nr:pilus assembly protein PilQ [Schwartzia sp. (in: firmicutes)]